MKILFLTKSVNNWDSCPKIYRTYQTLDDIKSNKSNNLLNAEKLEILKGVVAKKSIVKDEKYSKPKVEVLEYWGDIELTTGEIFKKQLICCRQKCNYKI